MRCCMQMIIFLFVWYLLLLSYVHTSGLLALSPSLCLSILQLLSCAFFPSKLKTAPAGFDQNLLILAWQHGSILSISLICYLQLNFNISNISCETCQITNRSIGRQTNKQTDELCECLGLSNVTFSKPTTKCIILFTAVYEWLRYI